ELVNEVFGTGTYTIEAGDVWSGLASYRLNDWRNDFIKAARTFTHTAFTTDPAFCDEKTIKKAVKWYTKWTGEGNKKTAPYQWHTWEEDGRYKKSDAVIETFAIAHLDNINAIPAPTDPIEDLPVGALIHALQAVCTLVLENFLLTDDSQVEHSLKEYRTGTRIVDKTPRGFYSAENYGDKEIEKKDDNGRLYIEKTPTASRYIATFKGFEVKHWKAILDAA
ncbi:hypothetical protein H0H92_014857, partial [Tricholoma furcatifolium]